MAVAITRTDYPTSVSAVSSVSTYTGISIGAASSDRIIAVCVGIDTGVSHTVNSATIDYGSGDTAMNAVAGAAIGEQYARIFYLAVPSGTTATIKLTFSGNVGDNAHGVAVYSITGASPTLSGSGTDTSSDMDVTDPLTTGSITIPTDGGFLAVASCATNTVGKSWANATEDIDADQSRFRFTTAYSTTSGTPTITGTGTNNGEDGAMAWVIFAPLKSVTAGSGSYAITGTAAAVKVARKNVAAGGSYAFTGATAAVLHKWKIAADAGSYAISGTAASLEHNWKVTAEAGSYAISGTDASLELGREVAADAGSYAISGTAASILHQWELVADGGSYALSGTAASLVHDWVLTAASGSYLLVGADTGLIVQAEVRIDANAGSYAITGTAALVEHDWKVAADGGSYLLTGTDAAVIEDQLLTATGASYVITGNDAFFSLGVPPSEALPGGGKKKRVKRKEVRLRDRSIEIEKDGKKKRVRYVDRFAPPPPPPPLELIPDWLFPDPEPKAVEPVELPTLGYDDPLALMAEIEAAEDERDALEAIEVIAGMIGEDPVIEELNTFLADLANNQH